MIGIRVVIWGRFVIKEEDSLRDPRFPTIFHCHTRCLLFCWCRDVAGGSVVAGWDQLERTGPKDDRQVTVGSEGVDTLLHDFGAPVSRVLAFKYWEFLIESVGGVVYDNIT